MNNKYTERTVLKDALLKTEQEQRDKLKDLVDEAFLAYSEAHKTAEGYAKESFYQSLMFKAINDTPEGTYQRQGAILICIRFMQMLIQHYKDMRLDPERNREH